VAELIATRAELLSRRARITLARQGRDLLTDKRAALMREFGRLSASVLEREAALGKQAIEARRELRDAVVFDGPEVIGSSAFAASGAVDVRLSARSVAGVLVVEIEHDSVARPRTARGYSLLATTVRTDLVAASFETQLDLLLDAAAAVLSLRRLAGEIARTTRRISALEHVVVPGLELERDMITMVLEEREREDRVRLRRARAAVRRREARPEPVR
jgi:V/A-type H+/Na+-transporting ATPase subunit D